MAEKDWTGVCWACGGASGSDTRTRVTGRRRAHKWTAFGVIQRASGEEHRFAKAEEIELCHACFTCYRRWSTFVRRYRMGYLDSQGLKQARAMQKAGLGYPEIARALRQSENAIRRWLSPKPASTRR